MTSLYSIFQLGGWVMYVIAFAAWVGLAVFLLKFWHTRKAVVIPREYVAQTLQLAHKGELSAAYALAKDTTIAGRLAQRALDPTNASEDIEPLLEEAGRKEIATLARYNGVLSTVASISPLLGLLGTVLGLILMFQSVGGDGHAVSQVSADVMSNGIWKAMLTTAWGLIVAIPALLGSKWLAARVDRRTEQLEDFSAQLARLTLRHRERDT